MNILNTRMLPLLKLIVSGYAKYLKNNKLRIVSSFRVIKVRFKENPTLIIYNMYKVIFN